MKNVTSSRIGTLAGLLFVQMLPATLVTPAIRPLFAVFHGGGEGPMHAFLALNMAGAVVALLAAGSRIDRLQHPRRWVAGLCLADAALWVAMAEPLPTALVLTLRVAEGVAHTTATTILLAEAAGTSGASTRPGRAMGAAGAGITVAIALGSTLGGLLLRLDPRAPFWGASALAVTAATMALARNAPVHARAHDLRGALRLIRSTPGLRSLLAAAFVERFTVGCLVVTFALFARTAHGLPDHTIGLLLGLVTMPFALLTYPAGRLGERIGHEEVLTAGGMIYFAGFATLGHTSTALLPFSLLALGAGSALLYTPTLSMAAQRTTPTQRGTAMALITAAGCAGMLFGPAAAGITTNVVGHADRTLGYRATFLLAAAVTAGFLALYALGKRKYVSKDTLRQGGDTRAVVMPSTLEELGARSK